MNNKKMLPIKSIEIDLGGKAIKLTLKQARTLFEALDEIFTPEEKIREIIKKEYIPSPYPVWPIPWQDEPYWPRPRREIWLETTTGGTTWEASYNASQSSISLSVKGG